MAQTESSLRRLKLTERLAVPERVLKYLIRTAGLGIGSRVLFVGLNRPLLPRFCQELGMNGAILLHDEQEVSAWQRKVGMPISTLRSSDHLPFSDHEFDLILVNESFPYYQRDLLGIESRTLTAGFLASLRPGGVLAFRQRFQCRNAEPGQIHSPECFESHLQGFEGRKHSRFLRDSLWRSLVRGKSLRRKHRPGFWVTTLQNPADAISRQERLWQAQKPSANSCCENVPQTLLFPTSRVA